MVFIIKFYKYDGKFVHCEACPLPKRIRYKEELLHTSNSDAFPWRTFMASSGCETVNAGTPG